MFNTNICINCAKKECKETVNGTLDICEYGVAYYNAKGRLLKKEALIPLRYISNNLRHELHPILNLIVQEANKIDPTISLKKIKTDNPASRILGATLIIDHFIQMITGVNEFHPDKSLGSYKSVKKNLFELIENYFSINSILKNTQRADYLNLTLDIDKKINVSFCCDIIEYLISILMDNIWKHSFTDSDVYLSIKQTNDNLIDVIFNNRSIPIPKDINIFEKGIKSIKEKKGFGYGLYWATVLIDHYNRIIGRENNCPLENHGELKLEHSQVIDNSKSSNQKFILSNVIVSYK